MRQLVSILPGVFILLFSFTLLAEDSEGYDPDRLPLAAPLLASTYLGGNADEGWIYGGEIDNAIADDGCVLVAGLTASTDFPTRPECYECPSCGGQDLYIARFSPGLDSLLSVIIIGGSGDDQSPQICIFSGSVYLAGMTYSSDFPTTAGAFSRIYAGNGDMIVAKFDAELTTLVAATYIGSPAFDGWYPSLAIDDQGSIFVASNTSDSNFPTTEGAYSRSVVGSNDCYIVRLSNDLSAVTAGTFIGGSYDEKAGNVSLTPDGNVVVATASESDDYPWTEGAYDTSFSGTPQPGEYIHDVAISVLDNDLSTLIASTYIGSYDYEGASLLTVGNDGSIFVGGHTSSTDYPVSVGAVDPDHNGTNEFFITRMSSDLSTLEASTFLTPDLSDGWGFVYRGHLVMDASGHIVTTGTAWDDSAYCTPDAYDPTFNGDLNDLHLAVLSNDLTEVIYATYVGGSGDDQDASVSCGSNGNIYISSYTTSTDFPMVGSPPQSVHGGGEKDCVVAQFRLPCCGAHTDGLTGNTNCSGDGMRTLSDITRLIDRVYISKNELCCEANGNTNGDSEGVITLSDITRLIDQVYISKSETETCD